MNPQLKNPAQADKNSKDAEVALTVGDAARETAMTVMAVMLAIAISAALFICFAIFWRMGEAATGESVTSMI